MFLKNLYLASSLNGIRILILNLTYLFIPIYLAEIDITGLKAGILLSMFFITGILFSPGFGILTDRHQVKWIITAGSFFCAVFFIGISLTNSFIALFFMFTFGGLGNSVHEVSIMNVVMKSVPEKCSGAAIGVYFLIITPLCCLGIGLAGLLIDIWNFNNIFILSAVVYLLIPLIALPIVHNICISPVSEYQKDFMKKEVWLFIMAIFLFISHCGCEQACLALYLKNFINLNNTEIGIFLGTVLLFLGFAAYIAGLFIDKSTSPDKLIIPGIFLSGIGSLGFIFQNIYSVYFFRILHETGDGIISMFIYIGIYRLFPKERIGGLAAAISSMLIMGRFIGTLIYSPIGSNFGYQWAFLIAGSVTLLIIPFIMLMTKTNFRKISAIKT